MPSEFPKSNSNMWFSQKYKLATFIWEKLRNWIQQQEDLCVGFHRQDKWGFIGSFDWGSREVSRTHSCVSAASKVVSCRSRLRLSSASLLPISMHISYTPQSFTIAHNGLTRPHHLDLSVLTFGLMRPLTPSPCPPALLMIIEEARHILQIKFWSIVLILKQKKIELLMWRFLDRKLWSGPWSGPNERFRGQPLKLFLPSLLPFHPSIRYTLSIAPIMSLI